MVLSKLLRLSEPYLKKGNNNSIYLRRVLGRSDEIKHVKFLDDGKSSEKCMLLLLVLVLV